MFFFVLMSALSVFNVFIVFYSYWTFFYVCDYQRVELHGALGTCTFRYITACCVTYFGHFLLLDGDDLCEKRVLLLNWFVINMNQLLPCSNVTCLSSFQFCVTVVHVFSPY